MSINVEALIIFELFDSFYYCFIWLTVFCSHRPLIIIMCQISELFTRKKWDRNYFSYCLCIFIYFTLVIADTYIFVCDVIYKRCIIFISVLHLSKYSTCKQTTSNTQKDVVKMNFIKDLRILCCTNWINIYFNCSNL